MVVLWSKEMIYLFVCYAHLCKMSDSFLSDSIYIYMCSFVFYLKKKKNEEPDSHHEQTSREIQITIEIVPVVVIF